MEPLKELLNIKTANQIAEAIHRSNKQFSRTLFLKKYSARFQKLELKERILLLSLLLSEQLPKNSNAYPTLIDALKRNADDSVGLSGFAVWPLTQFVADYGLHEVKSSLLALKEMTQVSTSEFAIRPFLINHEKETLKILSEWTTDPNEHVRRWLSEGTRPLLPWGQKIPRFVENPELTWPILDSLKNDSAEYVQKSIANHLNDHSKNHPKWVLQKIESIKNEWIKKHALRTLIKKGNSSALKAIGISQSFPHVLLFKAKKNKIKLGESIELQIVLINKQKKDLKLILDLEMHFLKNNGKLSPKVFKGRNLILESNKKRELQIKVPIKKITTRKYYSGSQACILKINGRPLGKIEFELKT